MHNIVLEETFKPGYIFSFLRYCLGNKGNMSNVVAGVVRGQFPYLKEHIAQKKAIYERYKEDRILQLPSVQIRNGSLEVDV